MKLGTFNFLPLFPSPNSYLFISFILSFLSDFLPSSFFHISFLSPSVYPLFPLSFIFISFLPSFICLFCVYLVPLFLLSFLIHFLPSFLLCPFFILFYEYLRFYLILSSFCSLLIFLYPSYVPYFVHSFCYSFFSFLPAYPPTYIGRAYPYTLSNYLCFYKQMRWLITLYLTLH
jgi:hypothetical protein